GLYRTHGFISAPLAKQTGFSEEDLKLFWDALINMFDHDHSAARGEMATRKLIVFKHESDIGNASAHKLFELVQVKRKTDSEKPAREFSDYEVVIDRDKQPSGVVMEEKV
ncbi:MAG: type I CRISPR-associated protein Cas7, partial [Deltaproteobacteria bacterium]|nr:type I CRISPR-associated protein Cas7 [Deltaproteobacteria bacterium]